MPGLNPARSVTNPDLRNQTEQACRVFRRIRDELPLTPGHPNLEGMFEA